MLSTFNMIKDKDDKDKDKDDKEEDGVADIVEVEILNAEHIEEDYNFTLLTLKKKHLCGFNYKT